MLKNFRDKKSLLWLVAIVLALIIGFSAGVYVANQPIDSGILCDASYCGTNP